MKEKEYSMEKVRLKEFDVHVYPHKIWVAISKTCEELNGIFAYIENGYHYDLDFSKFEFENKYDAVTIKVLDKKTKSFGVLIVFKPNQLIPTTIAHESSHATGYILQHLCIDMDCGEATAYLLEYVVKCCYEAKNTKWEK